MCVAFVRVRCVGGWLDCRDVEGGGRRGQRDDGTMGRWDDGTMDRDSRWGDIVMISMYDG
jgi:hypothetical protein